MQVVGEAGFENFNDARSTNDAEQMTSASIVPVDETIRGANVDDRGASIHAAELEGLFAQIRSAVDQGDASGAIVIVDLLREIIARKVESNGPRLTAWKRLVREE